jgi:hypothetical protein
MTSDPGMTTFMVNWILRWDTRTLSPGALSNNSARPAKLLYRTENVLGFCLSDRKIGIKLEGGPFSQDFRETWARSSH